MATPLPRTQLAVTPLETPASDLHTGMLALLFKLSAQVSAYILTPEVRMSPAAAPSRARHAVAPPVAPSRC